MSRLRRPAKPLIVLIAVVATALILSSCAFLKPNSLSLSQPGGIGSVRVHFVLCTEPEESNCNPSEETEELQYLLGIAVPPGSTPPATVTAVPVGGGSPLVFTRSDEVATEIAAASANLHKLAEEEGKGGEEGAALWPPSGLQGVGYISNAHLEQEGVAIEWNVDADFGLPVVADAGPYAGPFATGLSLGFRGVGAGEPADRPVHCWRFDTEPQESDAFCFGTAQQGQVGTSDLKIGAPKQASAFLGGQTKISFPFAFASTASSAPGFAVSASSTLPKAKLKVANPNFIPGAVDASTHLAPTSPQTLTVTVPKNAKPGTYDVTITATNPQGGTASQVAKLKVTKPKLKLGGVKLNKAKGTATLSVKVPGAGTLTVSGKGIVKAKKKAKKAKKLKIQIRTKGKTKAQLEETGKAKVKAKLTFKLSSGIAVTKKKSVTLKEG